MWVCQKNPRGFKFKRFRLNAILSLWCRSLSSSLRFKVFNYHSEGMNLYARLLYSNKQSISFSLERLFANRHLILPVSLSCLHLFYVEWVSYTESEAKFTQPIIQFREQSQRFRGIILNLSSHRSHSAVQWVAVNEKLKFATPRDKRTTED